MTQIHNLTSIVIAVILLLDHSSCLNLLMSFALIFLKKMYYITLLTIYLNEYARYNSNRLPWTVDKIIRINFDIKNKNRQIKKTFCSHSSWYESLT